MSERLSKPTEKDFYREMARVAYVNGAFRNGRVGGFKLNAQIHDSTPLEELLHNDSHDWPMPHGSEFYSFTADRCSSIQGDFLVRMIDLTLYYEQTLENIHLPGHIAEAVYNMPSEDAIEAAGPSTVEHAVSINIDNYAKKLSVIQSVTYKDSNDELVSQSTSMPLEHEGGSWEAISVIPQNSDEDGPRVHQQFLASAARNFERTDILRGNFQQDLEDIDKMMNMASEIEAQKADSDLMVAFATLRSMRKVFSKQFNMKF
ncbi:hypothetical protein KC949_03505 [Candidatus Saccharibacteria bacterium]|nr:hypothetical protein [Candidatus Saccharibacteria bacterium]